MINHFKSTLWALCLLWSACLAAQTPEAALTERLEGLSYLQARFELHTRDADGLTIQEASGEMAFKRPGRFLWKQRKPDPVTLLADGRLYWELDTLLEQVIVRDQASALAHTPAAWLMHTDTQWLDDFEIESITGSDCLAKQCYRLTAKAGKDVPFLEVVVGFSKDSLSYLWFSDKLDQKTQVLFTHQNSKHAPEDAYFELVLSPEIEVIESF